MLAKQAGANGAHFVDTYSPSVGHDACQLPGSAWVNGIVVVPPSFPVHPNGIGMAGMAAAVLAELERVGFVWPATVPAEEADPAPATTVAAGSPHVLPPTGGSGPALPVGIALAALAMFGLVRLRPRPPADEGTFACAAGG